MTKASFEYSCACSEAFLGRGAASLDQTEVCLDERLRRVPCNPVRLLDLLAQLTRGGRVVERLLPAARQPLEHRSGTTGSTSG